MYYHSALVQRRHDLTRPKQKLWCVDVCSGRNCYTCTCIYIYIYIYLHLYIHTPIYIYIYIHTFTHTYIYDTHTHIYIYEYKYILMYPHEISVQEAHFICSPWDERRPTASGWRGHAEDWRTWRFYRSLRPQVAEAINTNSSEQLEDFLQRYHMPMDGFLANFYLVG